MKSKITAIVIFVFFGLLTIFILRFIIGGGEDTWICEEGTWVKHGSPSAPMPGKTCDK